MPVHSAVPMASTSHGWLTGRGARRTAVAGALQRDRDRVARSRPDLVQSKLQRALDGAPDPQPPTARIHGRNVPVDQQVVEARWGQLVPERFQRHPTVAGSQLKLFQGQWAIRWLKRVGATRGGGRIGRGHAPSIAAGDPGVRNQHEGLVLVPVSRHPRDAPPPPNPAAAAGSSHPGRRSPRRTTRTRPRQRRRTSRTRRCARWKQSASRP